MSVLIKGMKMPTRCGRCDMCIKEVDGDIDYHYECCITAAVIKNLGEKMVDCPLVSVPPHGRLGDLDKLENGLRHMAKYQHGERQLGILGCCETIRLAPTVIEAKEE